jgi:co-chaperonin GroES (HSP10)
MALEPHAWRVKGTITPLRDKVLVCDMEHGDQKLASGLIIPEDDGKERGIRPRWCLVYSVGSEVTFVKPGDCILVAHGRWTRGVHVTTPNGDQKVVRMVESDAIMLVQEPD